MQITRVEEKCKMKYFGLYKNTRYILGIVLHFVLIVFVEGIGYIDLQNLQTGIVKTCVTALDVLCATAFFMSTDLKMSSGSQVSAPPLPPFPSACGSKLTFEEELIYADSANVELLEPGDV